VRKISRFLFKSSSKDTAGISSPLNNTDKREREKEERKENRKE
jgi:hypothetical protein